MRVLRGEEARLVESGELRVGVSESRLASEVDYLTLPYLAPWYLKVKHFSTF